MSLNSSLTKGQYQTCRYSCLASSQSIGMVSAGVAVLDKAKLTITVCRFLTVSDRFAVELGKHVSTGPLPKDSEAKVAHLLKGMKHLKLRVC